MTYEILALIERASAWSPIIRLYMHDPPQHYPGLWPSEPHSITRSAVQDILLVYPSQNMAVLEQRSREGTRKTNSPHAFYSACVNGPNELDVMTKGDS